MKKLAGDVTLRESRSINFVSAKRAVKDELNGDVPLKHASGSAVVNGGEEEKWICSGSATKSMYLEFGFWTLKPALLPFYTADIAHRSIHTQEITSFIIISPSY